MFRAFLAAMTFCLATPATAQSERMAWSGQLTFNPNQVVARDGGTLGALLTELTGVSAQSGVAEVSGIVGYLRSQPVRAVNGVSAGYQAITESSLTLGGLTLQADFSAIYANAGTSQLGLTAFPDGSFCADFEHCEQAGMPFTGWGSMVLILNDVSNFLIDETGITNELGDALGFFAGRTAARGEFLPPIQTQRFGVVSLDGLVFGLFARPGGQIVPDLGLPAVSTVVSSDGVGRTELWVYLEGDTLIAPIKVEGVLTGYRHLP